MAGNDNIQIAERYARAFIELGEESGAIDRLADDLHRVLEVMNQADGQLLGALCTPVFTLDERRAVVEAVLPRLGLHPLTLNLLNLLLDKGRFPALPKIVEMFGTQADERAGRVRVRVETAEPLTGPLEAEVRAALERVTGKSVILQTEVVPSLIGGMIARVGGTVYDASVRNRLHQIRHRLLAAQIAAEA
jgi:F-type H+-transporting ATPase subunit delta